MEGEQEENSTDATPNPELESCIRLAVEGDQSAIGRFFEALIAGPLFVPERFQQAPLSDQPEYPNDFFSLLGIQDQERVVVPMFSSPELIIDWCGNELSYRTLPGTRVFELMPEGWWITFNPGSELGKDLSPWEIDQLRGGAQNISAIVAENLSDKDVETLKVDPVPEDELVELRNELRNGAANFDDIVALYLLKETAVTGDGDGLETVLLGIELSTDGSEDESGIEQHLRQIAERALIGYGRLRVLCGRKERDALTLGLFKNVPPFYTGSEKRSGRATNTGKKGLWGLFSKS
jgi:hypothetical protein